MIRVGIIGASGYAGAELVRYLLTHPEAKITYLASDSLEGKPLTEAYPAFLGRDLPICEKYDCAKAAEKADFIFHAQKNGGGMKIAPELVALGKKFVDTPADFRLKDLTAYKQFYGAENTAPDLVAEAVYGVSELHPKEIASARIIANPGCYATSAVLALAPLMKSDLIDFDTIIVDSKSGVSGAGRSKLDVSGLFCEVNEGLKAYGVANHRHTPEIEQELSVLAGEPVQINFTPHLIPMNRGILTTAYAKVKSIATTADLLAIFSEFYKGRTFVQVLGEGKQPVTKSVFGSNFCHIGAVLDSRTKRAIITCAIDNMGKGAAGQAIQNMNLMCGLDETTGLLNGAVYP